MENKDGPPIIFDVGDAMGDASGETGPSMAMFSSNLSSEVLSEDLPKSCTAAWNFPPKSCLFTVRDGG